MGKEYCIDTSGISNPLETMPIDIYEILWAKVTDLLISGRASITQEIYDEMILIPADVGGAVKNHSDELILDVGDDAWEWQSYIDLSTKMQDDFRDFISEYNKNRKGTVGLNDLTIIAQAAVLDVPLVSMESRVGDAKVRRRIPDICDHIGVQHYDFNDLLRAEKIKL